MTTKYIIETFCTETNEWQKWSWTRKESAAQTEKADAAKALNREARIREVAA